MSQGLCPSCGAAVNLTAGQDEINCTYCGTLVKRPEAEAQFAEVKNSKFGGTLLIAETAQEGGSYAEALTYYNKVIEQQPDFAGAWLNKGICTVRTSKIGDLKIPEAISSWRAAIKFAKNPDAMKKRVALEINNVVSAFYPVLEDHYRKFSGVDDAYEEHVHRFQLLDSALALALEFNPESKTIAENGISLCDRFIESVRRAPEYGGAVADMIAPKIKSYKSKYEQAFKRADPQSVKYEARLKELGITPEVAEHIFANDNLAASRALSKNIWPDVPWDEVFRKLRKEGGFEKITDPVKRAETTLKAEYPERFSTKKKNGCFVATACYGNYDHPVVMELRHFRDDCLETSNAGQTFLKWYYQWSPSFANFIGKNTALKTLARVLIVNPAVTIARFFTKNPQ